MKSRQVKLLALSIKLIPGRVRFRTANLVILPRARGTRRVKYRKEEITFFLITTFQTVCVLIS